jgi:hypothetical protein
MADFDPKNLAKSSQPGVCPNCNKPVPGGTGVLRAGVLFCSLDCVAKFHEVEFKKHARELSKSTVN